MMIMICEPCDYNIYIYELPTVAKKNFVVLTINLKRCGQMYDLTIGLNTRILFSYKLKNMSIIQVKEYPKYTS